MLVFFSCLRDDNLESGERERSVVASFFSSFFLCVCVNRERRKKRTFFGLFLFLCNSLIFYETRNDGTNCVVGCGRSCDY